MAWRKDRGQTGLLRRTVVPVISLISFFLDCVVLLFIQLTAKFCFGDHTVEEQNLLNYTKRQFIVILTSILRIVAPCKVEITTDNDSVKEGTFYLDKNTGRLRAHLDKKSITICNHQIYTDWMFLWWLAYTGDIASNIFIMLKRSLRKIPVLGYGMENFNFIFMNRKWAQDKVNMSNHLNVMSADSRGCGPLAGKKPISVGADGEEVWDTTTTDKNNINWPYNLILFPEGTNLSAHTRKVNEAYSDKIGRKPYRHVLVPRSTGLRFCLLKLRNTLDVVYDITIGYSGIQPTEYGQDAYSLKNIFLGGKYPKLVSIYVRAFKLEDIPMDDELDFTEWLYKLWDEKDNMMEYFYEHGTFDNIKNNQRSLVADCSIKNYEFFPVFFVPIIFIYVIYRFWKLIF